MNGAYTETEHSKTLNVKGSGARPYGLVDSNNFNR